MPVSRISKEEALTFLITHLVIEQEQHFEMNAHCLFTLMRLAAEAESIINSQEGVIAHEVIEDLASGWERG